MSITLNVKTLVKLMNPQLNHHKRKYSKLKVYTDRLHKSIDVIYKIDLFRSSDFR